MTRTLAVLFLTFAPMFAEMRHSRRNERALRSAGAIEPADDVYRIMQVAYPACFLGMTAEGWFRQPAPLLAQLSGVLLFALGKTVKYWAVRTLGPRWTFRVLVLPGAPRVTTGPYRWLRHPNYLGVAGELAGVALLTHARRTGPLSVLLFGALMAARIRVENRAMSVCEPESS